jgi:tetratricopeptide (TPR) repeat protein
MCEVRLGDLKAAAQTSAMALSCAEEVADDNVMARTLTNVSAFYIDTGDMARSAQLLKQQLSLNQRTGNIEGEVVGLSNLGYAYTQLGIPEEGIPGLKRCIIMARAIGHRSFQAYGSLNLALAYIRSGDSPSALAELEQSLAELQAMNDVFGLAVGHTYQALAKEQLGQFTEAKENFDQAATVLREISVPGSAGDAESGLARCLLALNNLEGAEQYAIRLWEFLEKQAGAGMEFPILGYETCANVFSATDKLSHAEQIIEAGYFELMKRAEKISIAEWRKSFLEKVPEHRHIQASWQKIIEMHPERKER